jgi:hypothetical protein
MQRTWVWWAAGWVSLTFAACGGDEGNEGSKDPAKNAGSGAANGGGGMSGNPTDGPPGWGGGWDNPVGGALGVAGNAPIDVPLGCTGLQCQQRICATGSTTISGRVYDPAGKNPLYNVAVYVPNSMPMPFASGATCDSCEKLYSGNPVVTSLTDAAGNFKIDSAPDGDDIPLVVQIGKWRRQFTLPSVVPCQDNPVPDKLLTLPKNRAEGDIPKIAISTGSADTLECLLRRIGLDASEYVGGPEGDGRIHIFQGTRGMGNRGGARDAPTTNPPAPASTTALWSSAAELLKYDILLLSCEGRETQGMNQAALHEYASKGGRVFASHFHYAWFNSGPYAAENLATWTPGSNEMGNINATIVTSFPKGQALDMWLRNTNALTNGELPIQEARHNADVGPEHIASQPWILANQSADPPGATQYFSFNTPTDAPPGPDGQDYCGRVVYSDLHVGAASGDNAGMSVPNSCGSGDLSPQEKALEFMLFDLSACVIPDDRKPEPPIVL